MHPASLCVPSFWHNTGVWWTDGQTDGRICRSIYSTCKVSFAARCKKCAKGRPWWWWWWNCLFHRVAQSVSNSFSVRRINTRHRQMTINYLLQTYTSRDVKRALASQVSRPYRLVPFCRTMGDGTVISSISMKA